MSNTERSRFEETWRDAMVNADVQPPAHVWDRIELTLERVAGKRERTRTIFYQWLAAASLAAALTVTALYLFSDGSQNNERSEQLAEQPKANIEQNTEAGNSDVSRDVQSSSERENPVGSGGGEAEGRQIALAPNSRDRGQPDNTLTSEPGIFPVAPAEQNWNLPARREAVLPPLYVSRSPRLVIHDNRPDPLTVLLARLHDSEKAAEKQESDHDKLWTSVDVAAGSFRPSGGLGTRADAAMSPSSAIQGSSVGVPGASSQGSVSPGRSFSFGVNMGTRLSDRMVLIGGVSYLNQYSGYTSSAVTVTPDNVRKAALDNVYSAEALSSAPLINTSLYDLRSSLEYLSIPLEAGYVILDRRFGIQLNGGIATDIFLENKLIPDDAALKTTSYTAGDNPYFRAVNFSTLLGTEFSYRMGDRYRLALSPGLRYSMMSVYKGEAGNDFSPLTVDLGLRCRYIFK